MRASDLDLKELLQFDPDGPVEELPSIALSGAESRTGPGVISGATSNVFTLSDLEVAPADPDTVPAGYTLSIGVPRHHVPDAEYSIGGRTIRLVDGMAEDAAAPGSAARIVTRYFGNEARGDLNADGREDVVFLLTQETGGSGTFFYAVAALSLERGIVGSEALLIGDRVAPQATALRPDGVIVVNYADRAPGESFATPPSIGKTLLLKAKRLSIQDKYAHILPIGALVEKPSGLPSVIPTSDYGDLRDSEGYWRSVWLLSFTIAVLKATAWQPGRCSRALGHEGEIEAALRELFGERQALELEAGASFDDKVLQYTSDLPGALAGEP